jgi:hypothetical protein
MDGKLHLEASEKGADAERHDDDLLKKEVDEAKAIVRNAKERLEVGDVREARAIVRNALDADASGVRRVYWLLVMADVEFADNDLLAARDRLAEAVDASGREPEAVARKIRPDAVAGQISALRRNRLWRDALEAVEKLPAEIRDTAEVRAAVGDFYRDCGCHAHASERYSWRHDLRRSASWLRSGGPLAPIRKRICNWEKERLLPCLRQRPAYIDQVDDVGLEDMQAQQLRLQLETLNYRYLSHWYRWRAVVPLDYRLMAAGILPAWLVLLVVIHQAGFASGWGTAAGAAAVSVFIATSSFALLLTVLHKSNPQRLRTWMAWFSFAVVLVAAAGEGFDRRMLPVGGWWSWVLLGLVVTLAAIACGMLAAMTTNWLWRRWYRKLSRENCPLVLLVLLLDVLDYLRPATGNRSISRRLDLARELEDAAQRLTQDLLPSSTTSDLGSRDWLIQRAAGWAEAWRHMQRQMVASVPGDLTKLEELLVHEIRCLATCDIGALAWCEPPPPPSRLRQVITWARVILVAGLPLAAVLIIQQFVHVPGVISWATVGWAVLYFVLSLDPTIRDKVEVAHEIAGLLRTAPPPR